MFARNKRTKKLFKIIDRYESTTAAAVFQGGKKDLIVDGDIIRFEDQTEDQTVRVNLVIECNRVMIMIENGQINGLTCTGLQDDDILDLHHLSKHLKYLSLWKGSLTRFDMSALPRGLEHLILAKNKINTMLLQYSPPYLKDLDLTLNPLEEEGVLVQCSADRSDSERQTAPFCKL